MRALSLDILSPLWPLFLKFAFLQILPEGIIVHSAVKLYAGISGEKQWYLDDGSLEHPINTENLILKQIFFAEAGVREADL